MHKELSELFNTTLGLSYPDAKDNTSILINVIDNSHKIVFWNRKAEIYFGINQEAAIGKHMNGSKGLRFRG